MFHKIFGFFLEYKITDDALQNMVVNDFIIENFRLKIVIDIYDEMFCMLILSYH